MSSSPKPSYPIADFAQKLNDRANLNLSPVELAEILWLALQKEEVVIGEQKVTQKTQPATQSKEKESTPAPINIDESTKSQPSSGAQVVSAPPKTNQQGQKKIPTEGTALPVNIPETVALRNRREISRSLRPLMRKVPSKLRQEIDEAATVTHIAETQTWNPVVKPEPERWLELAIVIEVTNLLEVWRETIAEFCHVMERQGAFRDVRTWQLKSNEQGKLKLFLQTASGLKGSARRPNELRDFGGRRMVLFLSDCTSKAWRSGKILNLLKLWSRTNPVTIVQLLPEHYWDRTALDSGYGVALRSRHPGALSRDWRIDGLSPRQRQRLLKNHILQEGLKFPVITIQPEAIAEWAKAIAASDEPRATGILLGLEAFQSAEAIVETPALTPRQLVRQFRATASERAQDLADRMAVLPVNWSVIRLVQKNWQQEGLDSLRETMALPLAEIFLSGLISRKLDQYDFADGVRDVLLGVIPISEAQEVGEEIATAIFKQLPPEVQKRVAADIERRYGESLGYFEAFLIPDLPWGEEAAAEIFPFARVTREVLRRWGGEYAELAEELAEVPTVSQEFADFPPIKSFDFEVATIAIEAEENLNLLKLNFKVVTLVPKEQISNRPQPADIYFNENVFYEAFSRKGRYQSYEQLSENEQEGIDYRIRSRLGKSDFAIAAHHGGKIQPGTTEIAEAIAGENYSFYTFEGIKDGEKNDPLHIPSHRFNEPRALELVSQANRVIAIHGIADEDEIIYLGGLDDDLKSQIKQCLEKAGFTNIDDVEQRFRGISPQNICNRGQTGKGVQIGISWGLRKQLFDSLKGEDLGGRILLEDGGQILTEDGGSLLREGTNELTLFDRFIQAIRDALSPLEAAGLRMRITQGEADYYTEELAKNRGLDMIRIPGGSFTMGSPKEELESYDDERPQHQVTVPSFYIGRYPITQAQWKAVAELEPIERELDPDPSNFKEDYEGIDRWKRPVEQVSWEEAQEFCARLTRLASRDRLSRKTGKEYRLPTEAEWEYACRSVISHQSSVISGDLTVEEWNRQYNEPFHFGETISTELANYDGNYTYGEGVKGIYREQTTPVGYFKVANNFGLSDMHGNVWEWCEDDWNDNYEDAPTDGSAWLSSAGSNKVRRGGSWTDDPSYCRSAIRFLNSRDVRSSDIGFRVVCVAP